MLKIRLGNQNISLTQDLKVRLTMCLNKLVRLQVIVNENSYTSPQAQKLRNIAGLLSISEIGQTLVVSSIRHQLWVEWHRDGSVEIGVRHLSKFVF